MATVYYRITGGVAPYTVSIDCPGVLPEVKGSTGIYYFEDIPNGIYTISIVDGIGCVNESTAVVACGECLTCSPTGIFQYAHSSIAVDNVIFLGERKANPQVFRFYDMDDLSLYVGVTIPGVGSAGQGLESVCYSSITEKLYFAARDNTTGNLAIIEVEPDTLAYTKHVIGITANLFVIATDGTYIYGGTDVEFFKIRISDWAIIQTENFTTSGFADSHGAAVNINRGELYISSEYSTSLLAIVSLSDLAVYSIVDISSCVSHPTDDLTYYDDGSTCKIYVAGEFPYVGKGACSVDADTYNVECIELARSYGLWEYCGYIYSAAFNDDSIQRFSVDDPSTIETFPLELNFIPNEIIIVNNRTYVTKWGGLGSAKICEYTCLPIDCTTTTTTTVEPTTTTSTTEEPTTTTTSTTCYNYVEFPCGVYIVYNLTDEYKEVYYRECGEEEWLGAVSIGAHDYHEFTECYELMYTDCNLEIELIELCTTTTTCEPCETEYFSLVSSVTNHNISYPFLNLTVEQSIDTWCNWIAAELESPYGHGTVENVCGTVSVGEILYVNDKCQLLDSGCYIYDPNFVDNTSILHTHPDVYVVEIVDGEIISLTPTECSTTTSTTGEPTTTTTSTTIFCENLLCDTTLTVGEYEYQGGMIYGFCRPEISTEIGSIDPDCNNDFAMLEWEEDYDRLRLYWLNSNPCYTFQYLGVYINDDYYLFTNQQLYNDWFYTLESNPFPSAGQTCRVIICAPDCNTTTTTTTTAEYICDDLLCDTEMTVGEWEGSNIYGYVRNQGVGSLSPDCNVVSYLSFQANDNNLVMRLIPYWVIPVPCFDNPFYVYINEQQFMFTLSETYEGAVLCSENPFPAVGQTCDIIICGNDCTTTTTTTTTVEPTTTTSTTEEPTTTTTTTVDCVDCNTTTWYILTEGNTYKTCLGENTGCVIFDINAESMVINFTFNFDGSNVIEEYNVTGTTQFYFFKDSTTNFGYLTVNLISGSNGSITMYCPNGEACTTTTTCPCENMIEISSEENNVLAKTWGTYCTKTQEQYNAQLFTMPEDGYITRIDLLGWEKVGNPNVTLQCAILDVHCCWGGRYGCDKVDPVDYPNTIISGGNSLNTIKFEGTAPASPQWYSFCFDRVFLTAGLWSFAFFYPNTSVDIVDPDTYNTTFTNGEVNDGSNYIIFYTGSGYSGGYFDYKISPQYEFPWGVPLETIDLSCRVCYESVV